LEDHVSDEQSAKTPAADTTTRAQTARGNARATRKHNGKFPPEVRAKAIARYLDGEDRNDIIREAGCDQDTFWRWTREERAIEQACAAAADKRLIPQMVHLRALLLQRQIDAAGTVTGDEASRMLERLDARLAAILSATARPTATSDVAAESDMARLVRAFLDSTGPRQTGVVPS
jgi:transposase-like protein